MRPRVTLWLAAALVAVALPAFAQSGADSVADSAAADTAVGAQRPPPPDPVTAWSRWPEIDRAIALEALDGPQDILEKEEIIADRIDDLTAAQADLDTLATDWSARHLARSTQLEVLDDLASVQLGGDLELQQRVEGVREDVLQAAQQLARIDSSLRELAVEVARLRALSLDYRGRAARLRQQEEGHR